MTSVGRPYLWKLACSSSPSQVPETLVSQCESVLVQYASRSLRCCFIIPFTASEPAPSLASDPFCSVVLLHMAFSANEPSFILACVSPFCDRSDSNFFAANVRSPLHCQHGVVSLFHFTVHFARPLFRHLGCVTFYLILLCCLFSLPLSFLTLSGSPRYVQVCSLGVSGTDEQRQQEIGRRQLLIHPADHQWTRQRALRSKLSSLAPAACGEQGS